MDDLRCLLLSMNTSPLVTQVSLSCSTSTALFDDLRSTPSDPTTGAQEPCSPVEGRLKRCHGPSIRVVVTHITPAARKWRMQRVQITNREAMREDEPRRRGHSNEDDEKTWVRRTLYKSCWDACANTDHERVGQWGDRVAERTGQD